MLDLSRIRRIVLAREDREALLAHARRKLRGEFLEDETPLPQAFGLIAARVDGDGAASAGVHPLRRNARHDPRLRALVEGTIDELAVPSVTPNARRGWLADPRELFDIHRECERRGTLPIASYHVHRVAWEHDPLRDTPTALDHELARDQGLWVVIVSLVEPERPRMRAFWEGDPAAECELVPGA